MLPPIVCMTCYRALPQKYWDAYLEEKNKLQPQNELEKMGGAYSYRNDVSYAKLFDSLGIKRYCCRGLITTSIIDLAKKI